MQVDPSTSEPAGAGLRAEPALLWLPIFAWVLSLVCAMQITPTLDDWWASTPLTRFEPEVFLPGVFWRPFETLLRLTWGAWPSLYPGGLHFAVMLGHGLSAWLIWRLVAYLGCSKQRASWVSTLFLISPAVMMAAWSLDSANQTWSTACGLGALWWRLQAPRRVLGPWLFGCVLALFWKESGAAWFIAAPLLAEGLALLSKRHETLEIKGVMKAIGVGLGVLALYFLLRKSLAIDGAVTAQEGRYALNLSLVTTFKHVFMLLGAAWSTLETVALLSETHRQLWVAGLSAALGLPLLTLVLWHVRAYLSSLPFWLCVLGAGALMGPHAIFGRVSEMHTHPLLAATLVVLAYLTSRLRFDAQVARVALVLWCLGALGASGHKYLTWLETSRGSEAVTEVLLAQWEGEPVQRLCTVWRKDRPKGYATFSAGHFEAAGSGRALMAAWGWDPDFDTRTVFSQARCPEDWTQALVFFDPEDGPTITPFHALKSGQ